MKNLNSKGLTVVNLACWLSILGLIATFTLPMIRPYLEDQRAQPVISVACTQVRLGVLTYFREFGQWPKASKITELKRYLPRPWQNPYDLSPVQVIIGAPPAIHHITPGTIWVVVSDDSSNCDVVGYGRDDREIKRLACLPL